MLKKTLQVFAWSVKPAFFFFSITAFLFVIAYVGEAIFDLEKYFDAIEIENRFEFFFETTVSIIGVIITVMSIMIAITSSHYKIEIVELFIRDQVNVLTIVSSVSIFIFSYIIRILNTLGFNLVFATIFYLGLLILMAASYIFYTFYILSSQREIFFINKLFRQLLENIFRLDKTTPPEKVIGMKSEIIFCLSQLFDLIDYSNDKNNSQIISRLEEVFVFYRHVKRNDKLPSYWFILTREEKELLDVIGFEVNVENFFEDIIISALVDKIGQFIDKKDDSLLIRVIFLIITLSKSEIDKDLTFVEGGVKTLIKILNVYYEKNERWKINRIIEGVEEILFFMMDKAEYQSTFIKIVIKELQMLAILFYQKKIPVIIDRVALLIARLIIYLDRNPSGELGNELLVILLNIDRPLLEAFSVEKVDLLEQKGRVVRIVQISVALYYLHKIESAGLDETEQILTHALVKIIYNDMESEPAERIQLVRNDMENNLKQFIENICRGKKITDAELKDYYRHMNDYFQMFEVSYQNTEKIKFKTDLQKVIQSSVNYKKPLGVILVENGFIERQQLIEALSDMTEQEVTTDDLFYPDNINKSRQIRIGDILVEKGVISNNQLQEALQIQQKENRKDMEKFV